MSDFAKLFRLDGVGQVLVTLAENDDGIPAVHFRIPDQDDCEIEMSMTVAGSDDYDSAEGFAQNVFDAVCEGNIAKTIAPLIKIRDKMQSGSAPS